MQSLEQFKVQLADARQKHTSAKTKLMRLQRRVGPTSRELCEAKNTVQRLLREIARLESIVNKMTSQSQPAHAV